MKAWLARIMVNEALGYLRKKASTTQEVIVEELPDVIAVSYTHLNNAHLLFCMKYDDQPGMTRTAEYGRPFNRYMPTRSLVDLFDEEKDQRYAGSFRNLWIMNNEKGKGKYRCV